MTPAQCRAARALLGITQSQLARAAKLGLSTVVDFEKERRLVSNEAVEAIALSTCDSEKGPPWVPEKVMLVENVTIRDGPADLCAAPICVDNSVTGMQRNAIKAIRLVSTVLIFLFSAIERFAQTAVRL